LFFVNVNYNVNVSRIFAAARIRISKEDFGWPRLCHCIVQTGNYSRVLFSSSLPR